MANWRRSNFYYVLVFFITLCSAVCSVSSCAYAGGVHFGFGVDVPPPVIVERAPPPEVVYEGPVVVERRSSVYYYYRPTYQYHSYQVETERNYYRHRSPDWEDDGAY